MNSGCMCPVCFSAEYSLRKIVIATRSDCGLVECSRCGHTYTILEEEVDYCRLYSSGQYEILDTRQSIFDKIRSIDDRRIIRQMNRLNKTGNKKLLDFGCGKGQFLSRAATAGWDVKGIETATERATFGIEKYGLEIDTNEFESGFVEGGPFDFITLFHVLEHLQKPKTLLRDLLACNLAKNGNIVVEVPLYDSLQSRLAKGRWLHLDLPLHHSHFCKNSFSRLLKDTDLTPIGYQYFSLHVGVLGMVQSLMSLFGYRKNIITELKFHRTKKLVTGVLLLLPIATILEIVAAIFKRGGIIRVYCRREE